MNKPRAFYANSYLYLTLGVVIVILGFFNSYFSRLSEMDIPYHIHGVSATFWIILMVVQPLMYRWRKMNVHRFLGWISIILVFMIVFGGINMIQLMIIGQERYPPNIVYNLAYIDVLTLLGFLILYILALVNRKNVRMHARYMVCTIFGPLIPALTRVFFNVGWASNFDQALTYSYFSTEIILLLIIFLERKHKEIKYTYIPLIVFLIVQHLTFRYPDKWEWWKGFMDGFASM